MITFRALARSDLGMLKSWLNTPHVYEWWGRHSGPGSLGGPGAAAATGSQVEAKYGPEIDVPGPTRRFIIEAGGKPIGLIQWYRLGDFAGYARAIGEDPAGTVGVDLLIGDPAALGRGLGSKALGEFVTSIIFRWEDVSRVVGGPAVTNLRSIRAFAKAGFQAIRIASVPGEPVAEAIMARSRNQPAGL